jgi:glutathionyl-hydroquinone reductase
MGHLDHGRWISGQEFPTDKAGAFVRNTTTFRGRVTADGSSGHPAEAGRYHLYVSYACPWAHRTLIARSLLGLDHAISISVVHPFMGENGWTFEPFDGVIPDPIHGAQYLWQVYAAADATHTGRVTVPVLWDRVANTIVSNESREIIRMFSTEFREIAKTRVPLAPEQLRPEIDAAIEAIYQPINNGVYRAGFARTQAAYDGAVAELFAALDAWEGKLERRRFMVGDAMTEADICLFTTLFRFDAVYHTHFKCNVRRLVDYPALWGFARDMYQTRGVAAVCRLDHAKIHYYTSHLFLNPSGIVPAGPLLDFDAPHDRETLSVT